MPEVLSAMEAEARGGAIAISRACCSELAANAPKPHTALATRIHIGDPWPSGQSASPIVRDARKKSTALALPSRALTREARLLPTTPQNPVQAMIAAIVPGDAASASFSTGAI